MMSSIGQCVLAALLVFLVIDDTDAFMGKIDKTIRDAVEKYKEEHLLKSSVSEDNVTTLYFVQPLNHFNPYYKLDNITFKQMIMVNDAYWNKDNGPVFLFISGENKMSKSFVTQGFYVELAMKENALIVGVEHRFYGESINWDGLELEWLQYLSSQQALADLAEVHNYVTKLYGLNDANRWICLGGSYAGSLAAWFRIKYPHLVTGAIASSAPVKTKVDFEGYNNVVARSYSHPEVNGSQQCLDQISEAFAKVDQLIQDGKLAQLENDFKSCGPLSDPKDRIYFVSTLANLFMGVVQYNGMFYISISDICRIMTSTEDSYNNLVQGYSTYRNVFSVPCIDSSYDGLLQFLNDTTADVNALYRQWIWQTCAQFGYYQTCNNDTKCPFSKLVSVDYSLEVCKTVYEIVKKEVYESIVFTNTYYGSDDPDGSKIIFVNGSIDPWSALSILEDESETQIAVYIKGTSHCADFLPPKAKDPQTLVHARKIIAYHVREWLRENSS